MATTGAARSYTLEEAMRAPTKEVPAGGRLFSLEEAMRAPAPEQGLPSISAPAEAPAQAAQPPSPEMVDTHAPQADSEASWVKDLFGSVGSKSGSTSSPALTRAYEEASPAERAALAEADPQFADIHAKHREHDMKGLKSLDDNRLETRVNDYIQRGINAGMAEEIAKKDMEEGRSRRQAAEMEDAKGAAFGMYPRPGGQNTPAFNPVQQSPKVDPRSSAAGLAMFMDDSVMGGPAPKLGGVMPAGADPLFVDRTNAAWDEASPAERLKMEKTPGLIGRIARERSGNYAAAQDIQQASPANEGIVQTPEQFAAAAELRRQLGAEPLPGNAGQDMAATSAGLAADRDRRRLEINEYRKDLENTKEGETPEGFGVAGNALLRNYHGANAMGMGLGAAASKIAGADDLAMWFTKLYMSETAKSKESKAAVASFTDINSLGDVPTYVLEGVLSNLTSLAGMFVLGGAGAALAKLGGEKVATSFVAEQVAKELAKRQAMGAAVGASAGSIGMEVGSIYGDIVAKTGQEAPGTAVAFGTAAGLLDAVPAFRAAKNIFSPREAVDLGLKALAKRYTTEAGKQFLAEGFPEFLQQWIENGAVAYVDGKPLLTKENLIEAIDSFLIGGATGTVVGAGSLAYGDFTNRKDIKEHNARLASEAAGNKAREDAFAKANRMFNPGDQAPPSGTPWTPPPPPPPSGANPADWAQKPGIAPPQTGPVPELPGGIPSVAGAPETPEAPAVQFTTPEGEGWRSSEFAPRLEAIVSRMQGMGDNTKFIENGLNSDFERGKIDEEKVKFLEDNVRARDNLKRIQAGLPPDVLPTVTPVTLSRMDEHTTNLASALPLPIVEAARAKYDELAHELAKLGFAADDPNIGAAPPHIREVRDKLNKVVSSLMHLGIGRYAEETATNKQHKNETPEAFAKRIENRKKKHDGFEDFASETLGIDTRAHPGVDKSQRITQGDGRKTSTFKPEAETKPAGDEVVSTFTTAQGSTYEVHADGTTTRNKAARPEHPGDFGPQDRSAKTIYVTSEDANKLAEIQASHPERRDLHISPDTKMAGVMYTSGKDMGKIERRTAVQYQDQPAAGLTPVEYWGPNKTIHFGNEITAVGEAPAAQDVAAEPAVSAEDVTAEQGKPKKPAEKKETKLAPSNLGAKVTPQVASPKQLEGFISIAADSIKTLRKEDVARVIQEAPAQFRTALADHIQKSRPDLAAEVGDVLAERAGEEVEERPAPKANKPKPVEKVSPVAEGEVDSPAGPERLNWDAIFQNRDRNQSHYIAQMQDVANKPDYNRVSFSRTMTDGAPVVAGNLDIDPEQLGRKDTITAANGKKFQIQYAVIERYDAIASHRVDGSKNDQYLNQNLDDLRAIAGNGRLAGLQEAYVRGNAEQYLKDLQEDDLHGIDPEVIAKLADPILVRVMRNKDVTADIGDVTNTQSGMNLTIVEQAKNDVNRVDLKSVMFDDDGDLTDEAVKSFISALPATEHGSLMSKDGTPNKTVKDRAGAAVFYKAYGDDLLLDLAYQSSDPEIKNIVKALVVAAPNMFFMPESGGYNILPQVIEAAHSAVNAKRQGITIDRLLQQGGLLGVDPVTEKILKMFSDDMRSAKRMGEKLSSLAYRAYQESHIDPDIFGETRPPVPLDKLIEQTFSGDDGQTDMFGKHMEVIKANAGVNEERIIDLVGEAIYGKKGKISTVAVKEMLQNSFDAIKPMIESGQMDGGNIDITIDKDARTITVVDNGHGMLPSTLAGPFVRLADTLKETDLSSGGHGIAKALFVYGNEKIEVITMRDGKVSTMSTSGDQLKKSMGDKSQAPDIDVVDTDYDERFPLGHGTIVKLTIPKEFYNNDTNKIEQIEMKETEYDHPALLRSPLFRDIRVTFNGSDVSIGKNFPNILYTPFSDGNVQFQWGTARIYVRPDEYAWRENIHILSNGVWQFDHTLRVNPLDASSDIVPVKIYVDVVPKAKSGEANYPFALNRQDFSPSVVEDMRKLMNYLSVYYRQRAFQSEAQNFGTIQYIKSDFLGAAPGPVELLAPKGAEDQAVAAVKEGDKIKVVNGELIVNGKAVKVLTKEELAAAKIKIDDITIPQDQVDPNSVMLHDNLLVREGPDPVKLRKEFQKQLIVAQEEYGVASQAYFADDGMDADRAARIYEEYTKASQKRDDLQKRVDDLYELAYPDPDKPVAGMVPITEAARTKFGARFDNLVLDIGQTFMGLRNFIADELQYPDLKKEAIGISFDQKYRGVSIRIPFSGMFLNPAVPEFVSDPEKAATGMMLTMVHEIAHHKVRDHDWKFPAEMQREMIALLTGSYDFNKHLDDYVRLIKDNMDIITFLNEATTNANSKPIGKRFKADHNEDQVGRSSENISSPRDSAERADGLPFGNAISRGSPRAEQVGSAVPPENSAIAEDLEWERAQRDINAPDNIGAMGSNVGRKNYRGAIAPIPKFEGPNESRVDDFIYNIQDKLIDLKRVQQAILVSANEMRIANGQPPKKLGDKFNPYQKEELSPKRIDYLQSNFDLNEVSPILRRMMALGLTAPEVNQYLHARHAEEANDYINEKNPNPDLKDVGSRMSTQDARDYLANLTPEMRTKLDEIAQMVDAVVAGTQQYLVDSGLEKQTTIDTWRETYQYYVPLRRGELEFAGNSGKGAGSGSGVRGSATRRRIGSLKPVMPILDELFTARKVAYERGEKALIDRAFFALTLAAPNSDLWLPVSPNAIKNPADAKAMLVKLLNLGQNPQAAEAFLENLMMEPKVGVVKKVPGQTGVDILGNPVMGTNERISYEINERLRHSDSVLPVRIDGEDHFIFFNASDPRMKRLVMSLKNKDTEAVGKWVASVGMATRWFAAVNTQYNPVFGMWNFWRDVQGALTNLSSTPLAGKQADVLRDTWKALPAIMKDLRLHRKGLPPAGGTWSNLWQDMQRAGGTVAFKEMYSRPEEGKETDVEKMMRTMDAKGVRYAAQYFAGALSDMNEMLENAVRLAAYKVAMDNNMSNEAAASLAKNLTVNFNRRGAQTKWFSVLYAFFNASVQGTARMIETLKGPAKWKILSGGMAIGMAQAMLLAAAGFDDDDPPTYLKDKNLIIPIGDGKYFAWALPLGLNVLPASGRILTEMLIDAYKHGGKHFSQKMVDLLGVLGTNMNPLGGSNILQTVSPTIIDPFVAIYTNKDSFNRPISKEDRSTHPTPGWMRSRENSTGISQAAAKAINFVTSGGSIYTKGRWSPTGDDLDFLAGQVGGGVTREAMNAARFVKSKVTGEEIEPHRRPIVGKLIGDINSPSSIQQKFYQNVTNMSNHENEMKGRKGKFGDQQSYRQKNPEVRMIDSSKKTENEISALNKRIKDLQAKNPDNPVIKTIKDKKIRLMRDFNSRVQAAER